MKIKTFCFLFSFLIHFNAFNREIVRDEDSIRFSNHLNATYDRGNANINNIFNDEHVVSKTRFYNGPIDFSFNQSVCNPLEITFVSSNLQLQSAIWDFGDGRIGFGPVVTHVYQSFGIFNVKLSGQNLGVPESILKLIPVEVAHDNFLINLNDTSICLGQTLNLEATKAGLEFCWHSDAGFSATNYSSITVTPSIPATYYFNSQVQGPNLVINGDFSMGNSGFISDYISAFPNTTEGQYWVGNNSNSWNVNLNNCTEHTSATGNMMQVNGASVIGAKIWSQTVSVLPNTNYDFSIWVQTLQSLSAEKLKFSINNIILGDNINGGNIPCQWERFHTIWNSGNQTQANIVIVNNNNARDGNDFAIDDISFSKIDMQYDSVHVNVVQPPNLIARNDTSICLNSSMMLSANGAQHYSWTPVAGVSDPNSQNISISPTQSSQYIVTGWDIPGCVKKDTVTINVIPNSVFSIAPARFDVCEGDPVTMNASGADQYTWFSNKENTLSSSNSLTITAGVTDTLFVRLQSRCSTDTLYSIVKVNQKPIITIEKSNDIDCVSLEAQLMASGGASFNWSPSININDPNIPNPVVHPDTDTWYTVLVSNGGCMASDSIMVHANLMYGSNGFYIPNAFTPNNDGKNDCFNFNHWATTTYFELWIYNRWGELVFHSTEKNSCWDGTYKYVKQPSGVYIYQVKAESPCSNQPIYKKGIITLIR
jgi:gliding motility-associated-like protein